MPGPFRLDCEKSATTGLPPSLLSCQHCPFQTETLSNLLHHAEVHSVPSAESTRGNLRESSRASLHRNPCIESEPSTTGDVGAEATILNCGTNTGGESAFVRRALFVETIPNRGGKRYFACNLCPYNSNHKDTVVRHIRTHTKERPFKCNLCSSSFLRKHHLTKHITSAHGDKKP